MPSLKQIRTRIKSIKSISKVTKTMELISAIKFQKYLKYLEYSDLYLNKLSTQLVNLLEDLGIFTYAQDSNNLESWINESITTEIEESIIPEKNLKNFSTKDKEVKKIIVLLGSDKGLNGEFMSILRKHIGSFSKNIIALNTEAIVLGNKLYSFAKKQNLDIFRFYKTGDLDNIDSTLEKIFGDIIQQKQIEMMKSEIVFIKFQKPGKLLCVQDYIFDQNLVNLLIQSTQIEEGTKISKDVMELDNIKFKPKNLLIEPNVTEVIMYYFINLAKAKIYNAILNTLVAENFSRMLFMKNATKNANEIKEKLTLKYNKTRQEIITKEITEIVAGSLGNENLNDSVDKYVKIYIN